MSDFNEQLPQWDNPGAEPPGDKKTQGWQPTEKPPAEWFNWLFNRTYKTLSEIRTKIGNLGLLGTTDKSSVVNAINEIDESHKTHLAENATDKVHGIGRGVLVGLNNAISIPTAISTIIPWEKSIFDTEGFWSVASPTRIIIPSGVSKIRLSATVVSGKIDNRVRFRFYKNGSPSFDGNGYFDIYASNESAMIHSTVIPVIAGDYFETEFYHTSGVSKSLAAGFCGFGLEVIA